MNPYADLGSVFIGTLRGVEWRCWRDHGESDRAFAAKLSEMRAAFVAAGGVL